MRVEIYSTSLKKAMKVFEPIASNVEECIINFSFLGNSIIFETSYSDILVKWVSDCEQVLEGEEGSFNLNELNLILKKWRKNTLLSLHSNNGVISLMDSNMESFQLVNFPKPILNQFRNEGIPLVSMSAELFNRSLAEVLRTVSDNHSFEVFQWIKWKVTDNQFNLLSCDSMNLTIKSIDAPYCKNSVAFYMQKKDVKLMKMIIASTSEQSLSFFKSQDFLIIKGNQLTICMKVAELKDRPFEKMRHSEGTVYDFNIEYALNVVKDQLEKFPEGNKNKLANSMVEVIAVDGDSLSYRYSGDVKGKTEQSFSCKELNALLKDSGKTKMWKLLIPDDNIKPALIFYEEENARFERFCFLTY